MNKKTPRNWVKFCSEDLSKIEGFERWLEDTTDVLYHCHHKLEIELGMTRQELIDENLYYDRPASELIIMTESEHKTLHNRNISDETRRKIGDASKNRSEDTLIKMSEYAKNRTEEHRRKLSEAAKNRTEEHRRKLSEAASKRMKDKHWWTNGVINKQAKECPGPDFVPGRLSYK